jgi:hypothetical protein
MFGVEVNKKLMQYSVLTGAFILVQGKTQTQVVYHDIDPDSIFDEGGEGGWFDLDNNEMLDIGFLNSSFTFYWDLIYSYVTRQDILAGPYIQSNAVAGTIHYYSGFESYFPYALNQGQLIGETLSWQSAPEQVMGKRDLIYSGTLALPCVNCDWYAVGVTETLDHYLGIRFMDSFNSIHYGWMRCDVKDEGRTLIIKDYAYELEPDYPILAGDTAHFVSISENNINQPIISSFGNIISIKLESLESNGSVYIYETSGKLVYQSKISNQISNFMLPVTSGIYLINLLVNNKYYNKKIWIQVN